MLLHRTLLAVVVGALGSVAVATIAVSAPKSGKPVHSPRAYVAPDLPNPTSSTRAASRTRSKTSVVRGIGNVALSDVVERFCTSCHNPRQLRGNLDLTGYNVDSAPARLDVSEKMIRKLRAQM